MSQPSRRTWWHNAEEMDRLKRSVDLSGLVRAHGVSLKPEGADLVGLCPFHEENTPSFRVTPSKNLWHCFGCGKGGSVVDWLVQTRGISIREAFDHLRVSLGVVDASSGPPPDLTQCGLVADVEGTDASLLGAVTDYYAARLQASAAAREYLTKRGLWSADLVSRFRLGYADRTLGQALERHPDGVRLRERLTTLGVFRDNGREHLNGSLVVPILGEADKQGVCETLGMYGRKVGRSLRAGTPEHLYLKGEHRGVFNAAGIRASLSSTVVLCESLLDALTLLRWGIEPVTCAYGVHGVTPELWEYLVSGFCRVVIAYDADTAGDAAAVELATRLDAQGIEAQRLCLPAGEDVNSFALTLPDPARTLRESLAQAQWLGKPLHKEDAVWRRVLRVREVTESVAKAEPPSSLAAPTPAAETVPAPLAETADAAPVSASSVAGTADESSILEGMTDPVELPKESPPEGPVEGDSGTYETTFGDRAWRAKGLYRNRSDDVLRVTLRVSRTDATGRAGFHLDTLDLYQAKARDSFARTASAELGIDLEVCRADLARLIVSLEAKQSAYLSASQSIPTPSSDVRTLTPSERDEALSLLRRPDMLRQLLSDLETSGMVGEEENKLLCWLALTSRRLESPLGVLIQSTSAAGKSSLLDGVLRTMPEEDVVRYSAMSGQALFYMGGVSLKHKVLCVAEEEGARRASYSLKLLQSDGELSMASTGKDPESGQLVTKEYKTEGPVALALTTTSLSVDPELQNRCLVLSVDESREQTEAIHARQRLGRTRSGQVDRRRVSERLSVWRNAQRLLQPLEVVNPYAQALTFASHRTRTRRDMAKYLTLVDAVALSHQYQKVRHRDEHGEYIEVDLDDIELANRLAVRGLGVGLRELSGPTERLLRTLRAWVRGQSQKQGIDPSAVRFTRRDLNDCTPWSATQLKEHLRTLVDLEVLAVVRGKAGLTGSVQYQLEDWDEGSFAAVGLLDLESLRGLHGGASYRGTWASGVGGPEVGRESVGSQNRPTLIVTQAPEKAHEYRDSGDRVEGGKGPKSKSAGSVGKSHKGKNGEPVGIVAELVSVAGEGAAA